MNLRYFLTIVLAALMFYSTATIAQDRQSKEEIEYVNLFEFGRTDTSEGVDFRNFVANVNACIQNAQDFDWLGASYVGEVKDQQEAKEFMRQNLKQGEPLMGLSGKYDKNNLMNSVYRLNVNERLDTTRYDISGMIDTLVNQYVAVGDAVYSIEFVTPNLDTLNYYVFVDSKNKRVITEGNMLGFKLPLDFVKLKTAKGIASNN